MEVNFVLLKQLWQKIMAPKNAYKQNCIKTSYVNKNDAPNNRCQKNCAKKTGCQKEVWTIFALAPKQICHKEWRRKNIFKKNGFKTNCIIRMVPKTMAPKNDAIHGTCSSFFGAKTCSAKPKGTRYNS